MAIDGGMSEEERVRFREIRSAFERAGEGCELLRVMEADPSKHGDAFEYVVEVRAPNKHGVAEIRPRPNAAELVLILRGTTIVYRIRLRLDTGFGWDEHYFDVAEAFASSLIDYARNALIRAAR